MVSAAYFSERQTCKSRAMPGFSLRGMAQILRKQIQKTEIVVIA